MKVLKSAEQKNAPLSMDMYIKEERVMHNYKKPLMMKIVGLNTDTFFYQVKVKHTWKQYKKSVGKFIHMMYALFPDIMKQADKYKFDDMCQLANWLYNYGEEVKPCDTYIFYNK